MRRLLVGLIALSLGCSGGTRVDVLFDAEPGLSSSAAALEIAVVDSAGTLVFERVESLEDEPLPRGIRLEPAGGEDGRSFLVIAHLQDAAGERIARVAYGDRYADGEARQIQLRFELGCGAGLDCGDATTCRSDACTDACTPGTGACGATPDGGAPDGGTSDGGPPIDAGPPEDAGPLPAPRALTRAVERFEVTETGDFSSALGGPVNVDATEGAWVVLATAAVSASGPLAGTAEARLLIDDVEVSRGGSAADSLDGGGPFVGFGLLASGASHTVDVQLMLASAGQTARLQDVRVVAFPLPEGTAVYAEDALAASLVLETEGWRDVAELRFTPSSSARHLVMAQVAATTTPAVDPVGIRLVDGDGGLWPESSGDPPHLAQSSADFQTFFVARAPTLTSGSEARFTLQARAGAPSSNIRHARLLALDLSRFALTRHDEAPSSDTTSAVTPVTLASVDVASGPAREWVGIGSVVLAAEGTRGATLRAGAISQRYDHGYGGAARLSYPFVASFVTRDAFSASTSAFGAGAPVAYREAVVHLLAW